MAVPAFQIVMIRPADFIYAESWREAIDAMHYGLNELGIDAPVRENSIAPGARPIIFGAHHMAPGMEELLPPDTVLYNLEQLLPGYPWYSERYLAMLRRFTVWDFDARNTARLRNEGINNAAGHVPIGYVRQMTNIISRGEDVDVLFYGVLTERRQAILRTLNERGLKVITLRGVFGAERDAWIARAKVVLNLHQQASGGFEALRVLHLMANRKAVVVESNKPGEIDSRLMPGMCAVSYDQLVEACEVLVRSDEERNALAAAAYTAVQHPDLLMSTILRRVLRLDVPAKKCGDVTRRTS